MGLAFFFVAQTRPLVICCGCLVYAVFVFGIVPTTNQVSDKSKQEVENLSQIHSLKLAQKRLETQLREKQYAEKRGATQLETYKHRAVKIERELVELQFQQKGKIQVSPSSDLKLMVPVDIICLSLFFSCALRFCRLVWTVPLQRC